MPAKGFSTQGVAADCIMCWGILLCVIIKIEKFKNHLHSFLRLSFFQSGQPAHFNPIIIPN